MFLDKYGSMFQLPVSAEETGKAWCRTLLFDFYMIPDNGMWSGNHKYRENYILTFKDFTKLKEEFQRVKRRYSKRVIRADTYNNFGVVPSILLANGSILNFTWNWKYKLNSAYVDGLNFEWKGVRYFYSDSITWSPTVVGEDGTTYIYLDYMIQDPFRDQKKGSVDFHLMTNPYMMEDWNV